ncbi:hypothetical protein HD806DRAFT_507743 [Xylariaceae sp. AK1471]|nr:hypothetical protein HD806DRAFT_507743 [Xylariaceae sp. AK1471]
MSHGSKQFHSKSRNGCGQCKKRKVRCNGQGPICSNCYRRNERCDYLQDYCHTSPSILVPPSHENLALVGSSFVDYRMKTMNSTEERFYLMSCTDLFTVLDYYPGSTGERELLAHATKCFVKTSWVAPTLSSAESALGKQYNSDRNQTLSYLLPCISSLLAMYRTLGQGSQFWGAYASALQYNITASTTFRSAEYDVNENNWVPILMYGVGHIMFTFAAAQCVPDRDFEYLEIFHVLRSTAMIGDQIGVFLEKSELGEMLEYRRGIAELFVDDDSLRAIERLSSAVHPKGTLEPTRIDCDHARDKLRCWVQIVNGCPRFWKQFSMWPASVSDGFVRALTEKQPVALLIYVYWCAIMYREPRRWYTDGWHRRVAFAAMSKLGSEHDGLLEWPVMALSSTYKVDTSPNWMIKSETSPL